MLPGPQLRIFFSKDREQLLKKGSRKCSLSGCWSKRTMSLERALHGRVPVAGGLAGKKSFWRDYNLYKLQELQARATAWEWWGEKRMHGVAEYAVRFGFLLENISGDRE
jgi:hypothetical protein